MFTMSSRANARKLVLVSNYRLPTERAYALQIAKTCESLHRLGVSLTIVAPRAKKGSMDLHGYYNLERPIPIHYTFSLDKKGRLSGVNSYRETISFAISAAIHCFFGHRNEIIFSRDDFFMLIMALLRPRRTVFEIHSLPRRIRWYHRITWRRITKLIVISSGLRDVLLYQGVDARKIYLIQSGFDPAWIARAKQSKSVLRKKNSLPAETRFIMYTGSLMRWKGVYTLLDATRQLHSDYVSICIGGPPREYIKIREYVRENPLENFQLLPYMNHDALAEYIGLADILIVPNPATEEISRNNSPLKLFEYLATDKPVILSDVPALRDIANGYEGVYFFAPDDVESLVSTVKSIDITKTYHRDLSAYTWDARAKKIAALL